MCFDLQSIIPTRPSCLLKVLNLLLLFLICFFSASAADVDLNTFVQKSDKQSFQSQMIPHLPALAEWVLDFGIFFLKNVLHFVQLERLPEPLSPAAFGLFSVPPATQWYPIQLIQIPLELQIPLVWIWIYNSNYQTRLDSCWTLPYWANCKKWCCTLGFAKRIRVLPLWSIPQLRQSRKFVSST